MFGSPPGLGVITPVGPLDKAGGGIMGLPTTLMGGGAVVIGGTRRISAGFAGVMGMGCCAGATADGRG